MTVYLIERHGAIAYFSKSPQSARRPWHLFHFANYLWYPFVSGFTAGQPGLQFLFLFDPPARIERPPFPADWLAILAHAAAFGEEALDVRDIFRGVDHPAHQKRAHGRLLHTEHAGMGDMVAFWRWFVPAVDALLYNVADAANFTVHGNPEADIDARFAFEHLLTMERVVKRTIASMCVTEVGSAKAAVFEIADLFDTLSKRFCNTATDTEFFKTLFNPSTGLSLIQSRLSGIPGIGDRLAKIAEMVYGQLRDTVLDSIWMRSKATAAGIAVRDRHLHTEIVESPDEFVANVMRAYRNGHHGYFTDSDPQNRPSRYLWMVDGNVPYSITALPALWLLAYIADPGLIGWKPLAIASYD